MNRKPLTRFAAIMAIIAVVSLVIAGVIAKVSGDFRLIGVDGVSIVNSNQENGISVAQLHNITINTLSEDIIIREGTGENVTARFHYNAKSVFPNGAPPRLQLDENGDTAKFYIEHPQHKSLGLTYYDAVLEISIPKQYTGKLSVESVSADIVLKGHGYTELTLKTISGDIKANDLKAATRDVDVYSTSGDVALTFAKVPDSITVKTISGDIRLGMPHDSEFTLDAQSTSGDVTCDLPIKIANSRTGGGEHSLSGTVESGKSTVKAHTVSGDIEITRNRGI